MALEGFLQEFGLADILQLIYFQKKTGVLNIEGKIDSIELSFINGNVAGLKSQRRLENNRLGKILIKKGLIHQGDLDSAIEEQKVEGLRVGGYFVKQGLVTKEALLEIVQEQIIEAIVQIFTWKEGRYEFIPQGVPVDKHLPIYLDTQHLLMDGLRIVDEWTLVEGKLDLNTVFKQVGEPETDALSDIEKEVLGLVGDDRDVISIINSSDSSDFETAKAIMSLQDKGIIEPVALKPLSEFRVGAKTLANPFYIAIYGVLIFVFIFMFKGSYDTFRSVSETKMRFNIERLKNDIDKYSVMKGHYPKSLEVITKGERDLWDRPYIYRVTESGFTLFSTGPDGVEGTDDDVY
jgi:hypothetical protein